jgi:hypothetical protein
MTCDMFMSLWNRKGAWHTFHTWSSIAMLMRDTDIQVYVVRQGMVISVRGTRNVCFGRLTVIPRPTPFAATFLVFRSTVRRPVCPSSSSWRRIGNAAPT